MLTRTDRRRFPILLAVIAVLVLAGAALGLLFSTVQAQESETLLSNLGQPDIVGSPGVFVGDFRHAQGFTTGSNALGYQLGSVELDVYTAPNTPADVTVQLWSATSDSEPGASVATLTHSTGMWATGHNTFDAPAGTTLEAGTTYFVFVSYSGARNNMAVHTTRSTSADSGAAAEWSVGQRFERGSGDWSSSSELLRFKINGAETMLINQPGEIRAYWTGPDPDNDKNNGNRRLDCAGTEPFRAYWKQPKSADEWEAEVTAEHGASNATHSNIEGIGDGFHELTGTVHIRDGEFGVVSIRVRGRFGDDGWGAWSRPTELFCNPPGGL